MLPPPANRVHFPPPSSEPFVVLQENRFAYTAVVQPQPAAGRGRFAPLFLYGPSGVGKSHLARHCLRLRLREHPDARCIHQTASEFAAQLADASANNTIAEFQDLYQDLELFILEDLHTLARRVESQRKLLSIIDELQARGCQMLLTSRKPAVELAEFPARLVSRCHGAVSAMIKLPGQASRESLLRHFAKSRQVPLSEDAAALLAKQLPVSPRELLGIVVQMAAPGRRGGGPVDIAFARHFLQSEVAPAATSVQEIARTVAQHFGVPLTQLRSRKRVQGLVLPRQCAMFLARELTSEGLERIGRFFGDRDHSTVLHACRRVGERLPEEPDLRQHLGQIRQTLGVG